MDLLRRLGSQLHHQRTARGVALLPFERKQVHARKPYRQRSNVDEQRDRQRHPDGGNGDTPMVAARCVEPVAHRFAKSACHADRLNRVKSRAGVGLRPAGGHIGEGLLATLNIHLRPPLGWLRRLAAVKFLTREASQPHLILHRACARLLDHTAARKLRPTPALAQCDVGLLVCAPTDLSSQQRPRPRV